MTDERLTEKLADRIFGWRVVRDRFLTTDRSWMPRWRFRPLTEIADAFRLLDAASNHYTVTRDRAIFTVEVNVRSYAGTAVGEDLPRAISIAVAKALGIDELECLALISDAGKPRKVGRP